MKSSQLNILCVVFFFFYFRYVGHSQGVTAMYVTYLPSDFDKNNEFFTIEHFVCVFFLFYFRFVMLSELPQYNDKITIARELNEILLLI